MTSRYELRLVPAALVTWGVLIVTLSTGRWLPVLAVMAAAVAVAAWARQAGQGVLVGLIPALSLVHVAVRRRQAAAFDPGVPVTGRLAAVPDETATGSVHVPVAVDGYPETLSIFSDDPALIGLPMGTPVVVDGARESVVVTGEADGALAVAHAVHTQLADAVSRALDGEHRGLLPAMALGDTSLQTEHAERLYQATGLNHLSAVSGANVAIVCTAALLTCRALAVGPRVHVGVTLIVLAGYIVLVGAEPSVLRAGVTGVVGLVAVVASSRMQPLHALAAAVLIVLIAQPQLALAYGFGLSVAATAGIVVVGPLIATPLMRARWPPILARAVGVAVAADLCTMPIIALMSGEVSLVAVAANLLAAPAAAPVTILGLIAAVLAWLPGPLVDVCIWLAAPATWWIHTVARVLAGVDGGVVSAGPGLVVLGYGWVLAGIVHRRLMTTTIALVIVGVLAFGTTPRAPAVDPARLRTAYVATEADVDDAPAGTELIVVRDDSGAPADRPTMTADGVPVLFPRRDGPVTVHTDGTQHASDGRF